MKTIDVSKAVYSFKPAMQAVETAKPGEEITFITADCWNGQICREDQLITDVDFSILNPATGPLYVEGAEPGDTLKVSILDFVLADHGVINIIPGHGTLGNRFTEPTTRILPIVDSKIEFLGLSLPVKPMIGVIGVATTLEDGEISTGTPWKHGGNMDTKDICAGAAIFLPVSQTGAMLAIGDVHALMGDGEVCVTGCEIGARVTVKVDLIKGIHMTWPMLETNTHLMIITSGETLDKAAETASAETVDCLSQHLGISWHEAYMLTSLVVDLKVSQCVDPMKTIRAAIPKNVISINQIFPTRRYV
jgi:amidase